jgi:hypothetical protein
VGAADVGEAFGAATGWGGTALSCTTCAGALAAAAGDAPVAAIRPAAMSP